MLLLPHLRLLQKGWSNGIFWNWKCWHILIQGRIYAIDSIYILPLWLEPSGAKSKVLCTIKCIVLNFPCYKTRGKSFKTLQNVFPPKHFILVLTCKTWFLDDSVQLFSQENWTNLLQGPKKFCIAIHWNYKYEFTRALCCKKQSFMHYKMHSLNFPMLKNMKFEF